MDKLRYFLATLIAPLLVPAILLIYFRFVTNHFHFGTLSEILFYGGLVSYAGLFLVGLPLVYLLYRINKLKLGYLVLWGAIEGVGVFALASLFFGGAFLSFFRLYEAAWGWFSGGSIALVFGLIAGIPSRSTFSTNPIVTNRNF